MPPVQAFYPYSRLSALWGIQPGTVRLWVADLRKTHPNLVHITYRLVRGHRRTAFLSAQTVQALQDRHFPRDCMPVKKRGSGPRGPLRLFHERRPADRQPVTPAVPSAPQPPASQAPPAIRRLRLPVMPSRYAEAVKARPR